MRQSGIVAAAGVYALDHNIEKLAEDHAQRRSASASTSRPCRGLKLFTPEDREQHRVLRSERGRASTSKDLNEELLRRGVRMGTTYGGMIRAVTHLDVSRADIDTAGKVLAEAVAALRKKA